MDKNKYRLNFFGVLVILSFVLVVLFVDDGVLNSLYVDYDDFVINEINIGSSDDSVVYNDVDDVVNVGIADDTSVSMVSNNVNKWVWPTEANYMITSYYGYRWGRFHGAIDINGPGYGSSIYAANSGVVVTVRSGCVTGNLSCNGKGGNYVIIKHNTGNYYTIYMHLKSISVSVNQNVSSGEVIGQMGNTGNVVPTPTSRNPYAGTHLHFGLYKGEPYKGGYTVNPMSVY